MELLHYNTQLRFIKTHLGCSGVGID